ncbi:MAG: VOC family protein [bacterium]|nr:VOC family protein [bacterium]MBK8131093.1 VOC family protein [bacterium]
MHSFCHIELATTNLEAAAHFYRQLFGWTIEPMGENYMMIRISDDPAAVSGGLVRVETIFDSGAQNYVFVDEVSAALKQAEALGARTIDEKRALPHEMGFIGMFEAPDGYKLGLFSQK